MLSSLLVLGLEHNLHFQANYYLFHCVFKSSNLIGENERNLYAIDDSSFVHESQEVQVSVKWKDAIRRLVY